MESYRHAIYRYSTGMGPIATVDVPTIASDVASFKMEPLLHNLIESEVLVNLKREADRVSMQVEDGMRQIKNLRYDPSLGDNLKVLKKRVELIRLLMTNYPITVILRPDLETLYELFVNNNTAASDILIKKVIAYNKKPKDLKSWRDDGMGWGKRVNKGYDIFDQFGLKLDKADKTAYKDARQEAKKGLSGFGGFGDAITQNPVKILGIIVAIVLVINLMR